MQIFFQIILMLVGLILLIKGSDIFVDASSNIARKLKVPPILIGLTIVAFGTGAPEIVISISSARNGLSGLAMGNLIGSNVFNLIFILGICSLIGPFVVEFKKFYKEFLFSILAAIAVMTMLIFSYDYITRLASAALLVVFAIYMFMIIKQNLKSKPEEEEETQNFKLKPLWLSSLLVLLGLGMILYGADLVVDGAVFIAETFGISERVIGLTIIAAGTSLPELSISIFAFKKGRGDLAIGNIIGSNVFNLLFIMGLTGVITPLTVDPALIIDSVVLLVGSLITLVFLYTGKKMIRLEGVALLAIYFGYMVHMALNM
ncbi:MAG: calcium/sodium antiporter [Defluviitaleaceae bacterium]|nr:calcium/sodium antiporter [Defluviitaleaceae bacterium]